MWLLIVLAGFIYKNQWLLRYGLLDRNDTALFITRHIKNYVEADYKLVSSDEYISLNRYYRHYMFTIVSVRGEEKKIQVFGIWDTRKPSIVFSSRIFLEK